MSASTNKMSRTQTAGSSGFTLIELMVTIVVLGEPPRDCRRPNILRKYDNEKTNLHS